MPRNSKPVTHGGKGKRIFDRETLDPLIVARLDLHNRSFTLKWVENEGQVMPSLLFSVDPPLTAMDMVSLTEHDLDNVQRMFQLAIDAARPIVQTLDAAANKMWDEGTGIPRRLYRTPPNFVYFGTPPPPPNPTAREGEADADAEQRDDVPGAPGT